MHTHTLELYSHTHVFDQDKKKPGEKRTLIVIAITAATMGIEIVSGFLFGSMSLLADGLHMGSHASALGISLFAYHYTRKHAKDERFSFGTGKINSLAAFSSGIMLVLFSLTMAWESVARLLSPVSIDFNQSIFVALFGLLVNGGCLLVLGGDGHSHSHEAHEHSPSHPHHDHNLWSAYLHVLTDAMTSICAVLALLAGKFFGIVQLDPIMGIVGAVLVILWSREMLLSSARTLLDMQAPENIRSKIKAAIEADGDSRIYDLHVWSVGPDIYASEIGIVADNPLPSSTYYALLPKECGLVHVRIETRKCDELVHTSPGKFSLFQS